MPRQIVLTIQNPQAAAFRVLGLSVLERNIRQLKAQGFDVQVLPDSGDLLAKPRLRGDVQYLSGFFKALGRDPENLSESLRTFPPVDVAELLQKKSAKQAHRILSNVLFAEIISNTEGWIATSINKKISFTFTRALVWTPFTPNQLTFVNFIIGVIGCVMLISKDWGTRAMGAFLIQMNSVLDGCDGEIAKLKIQHSRLGAWLDTIVDDVLNNLMFICLFTGMYLQFGGETFLKFCIATTFASFGVSFFIYDYLIKHNTQNAAHYRLSWEKEGAQASGEKSLFDRIKPVLKRDFFIFAAFILVALDLRNVLVVMFVPIWAAFFLYLASFSYSKLKKR